MWYNACMLMFFTFILVVGLTTQIANLFTTVYLHRGLSHRAVIFKKPVEWGMRFMLWLTTTIERRKWVAVHRKHHAFTDKDGDPHSPILKGFWRIQLWNFFYYQKEASKPETVEKYAKDIIPDAFDRLSRFYWLPVLLLLAIYMLILGPVWAPVGVACHFLWYIFLNSTINGAGHWFGYRRHNNTATNLWTVALLTAGEGLHNNHHARPSSAKLCDRWWEIDFGWMFTYLLSRLGLVQISR